jgi:hypothetical protein
MKKSFTVKAKIWHWPGNGGWHFVTLDKKLSVQIRGVYTRGFVPIIAKCGKSDWATSLFPHTPNKKVSKQVDYLLCINKKVLKNEGLFAGDETKVSFVVK